MDCFSRLPQKVPVDIPVSDAKSKLTELVRRAEAGEDIVLTRHGLPGVRLAPMRPRSTPESRWAVVEEVWRKAASAVPGPDAARSQDFLYDPETGLPA